MLFPKSIRIIRRPVTVGKNRRGASVVHRGKLHPGCKKKTRQVRNKT